MKLNNKLSNGLITLEGIFNLDDQLKQKKMNLVAKKGDYEPVAIVKRISLNRGKVCSETENETFIKLFRVYDDVFAWTYEDLKGFDPNLAHHTIELDLDAKLVRQKQRPINPKIEPLMRKELTKLIEARIIFPIKHPSWVEGKLSPH